MMEYLSICRVCLSENLDNDFSEIFDICENEITFCDILKMITPNVDFNDEKQMTKNICIECKSMCHEIIKFRDQILYSNETLNHPLKDQDDDGEEMTYRMEVNVNKLEDCYSLQEIQTKNEQDLMLTCEEMIIEVDENVYEEEHEDVKDEVSDSNPMRKPTTITHDDIPKSPNLVTTMKDNMEEHDCIICLQVFSSKADHDDHMNEHKQEITFDAIGCIYCKKFFDKFGTLLRHLKSHDEVIDKFHKFLSEIIIIAILDLF